MKWKRYTMQKYLNTCQCCGCTDKEKLEVHHIYPKSLYPELVNVENNLVCLCHRCHRYLHDVIAEGDNQNCNKETLLELYRIKGTEKGKHIRKKCKNRFWHMK